MLTTGVSALCLICQHEIKKTILAGASPLLIHLHKHIIKQREMKEKAKATSTQSGQEPKSVDWRARAEVIRLIMGLLGYVFGLVTLMWLMWHKTPLTTGDAALIMFSLILCLPTLLEARKPN